MRFSKTANKSRAVRISQDHTTLKVNSKVRRPAPTMRVGVLARVGNVLRRKKPLKSQRGDDALLRNQMTLKSKAYKQARTTDQEANRLLANRFGRKEKRLAKQELAPQGVGLNNRVE